MIPLTQLQVPPGSSGDRTGGCSYRQCWKILNACDTILVPPLRDKAASTKWLFLFFTTHLYCQKGNAITKLRVYLYLFSSVTLLYSFLLTFSVCLLKSSFPRCCRLTCFISLLSFINYGSLRSLSRKRILVLHNSASSMLALCYL